MRTSRDARIGVIGAGPSGLAAVKALLDEGYENLVVWDRGKRVGGNWVFDAASGHSSVFETTHIISSKDYSQYHDFPMPDEYPDYPGHRHLAQYFQAYADAFGLERFVRFQTLVEHATPRAGGGWRVEARDETTGHTVTDEVAYLVVANGHHWLPRWPDYPGAFAGTRLHSHDFKRAAPFAGQRVLVVGGGNSACDVAVESSRVSAHTDISMRRGYWIVPKFLFGRPSDHIHNATIEKFGWLPLRLRRKAFERLMKLLVGPNERYGMAAPDHPIFSAHPTLNSELHYFLRHGEITARPDIARFEGHTVHFTDGTSGEYDSLIVCTGYRIAHPFFERDLIDYSQGPVPLYLKMLPADVPDVAFIGLFQPLGCIWPAAELQAKILARGLAGRWQPPTNLRRAVARELAHPDVPQIDTPRHTITVDYPRFRKRLLRELGGEVPDGVVRLVDEVVASRGPNA